MRKIHLVLSAPSMFGFMRGQPAKLRHLGYDVTVIAAASAPLDQSCKEEGCARIEIEIPRNISPLADLRAFLALARNWVRTRPDAVMLSGPKAIFIGSMAAFITDVPCRLSIYHGMRQETLAGPMRQLVNLCDRAAIAVSTDILAVSKSLVAAMRAEGNDPWNKIRATDPGTANGVDEDDFRLDSPQNRAAASSVLANCGINKGDHVLLFMARVTADKGLLELPFLYDMVCKTLGSKPVHLIMVGKDETTSVEEKVCLARLLSRPRVRLVGHVDNVVPYLAVADVLVFPSHREGFGMAIIEAGMCQVPSVAYDVTGVRDAVANGDTGMLAKVGDISGFAQMVVNYLADSELRARHGMAARRHALVFRRDAVWSAYRSIFSAP